MKREYYTVQWYTGFLNKTIIPTYTRRVCIQRTGDPEWRAGLEYYTGVLEYWNGVGMIRFDVQGPPKTEEVQSTKCTH